MTGVKEEIRPTIAFAVPPQAFGAAIDWFRDRSVTGQSCVPCDNR